MKNLPELRQQLTDQIKPFDGTDIRIPLSLKRTLTTKWERAIEPYSGGIRLKTQKGDEHLTDIDLLKAAYARDLTSELLNYKAQLKEYLKENDINQKTAEELKASTNPSNLPSWWMDVEETIRKDAKLSDEAKSNLIAFATDNDWSGCTKGSGRGDFFISSVVNACLSNVTHNSMLGEVSKDLLDFKADVDQIIQWHSGHSPTVNFGHKEIDDLIAQIPEFIQGKALYKILISSLVTKPFSILTGQSGTGKTRLAKSITTYFEDTHSSNSAVVAVGADWTDNRNVLGFVNHLHTDSNGRPFYQSTPILDLLLRANEDSEVPYFLILDEMNLSHVERYFADFLSVMEQEDGLLKLHSESGKLTRSGQTEPDVPPTLEYPGNLFVIGTVNIDETTYMFSPKVLDRANVIEFTVSEKEIGDFLKNPQPYEAPEPAAPGVAEGFLALAKEMRSMKEANALPDPPKKAIGDHLLNLFKILKAGRFEFAYRSAKEITIYLQVCRHLTEAEGAWHTDGWKKDLDDQVLQKLLPKLHGSVGRIGGLLATLAEYCQTGVYNEGSKTGLNAALDFEGGDSATFPKSLAKLQAMIRTLKDEQFVSFIQ